MSNVFWGTYAVLWGMMGLLILLVLLLYRQFGLMSMRPTQRFALAGLDLGARVPDLQLIEQHSRNPLNLASDSSPQRGKVIVFTLPGCPICERLSGEVHVLPETSPAYDYVWITSMQRGIVQDGAGYPDGWTLALTEGEEAHRAMDVPASPYIYVVGADNRVLSKGLVNGLEDFEFLMDFAEHGSDLAGQREVAV